MRLSELINKLQEFENIHGDVPVVVTIDGFGGHGEYIVSDAYPQKLYINTFDEDFPLDKEELKEFFPDWDGDSEIGDDVQFIMFDTGSLINAT